MKKKLKQSIKELGHELIDKKDKKNHLQAIYHLILNQRRLTYRFCDMLKYYFRCFCCPYKCCCRKSSFLRNHPSGKRDYYLNKGIENLERDLDVEKFF